MESDRTEYHRILQCSGVTASAATTHLWTSLTQPPPTLWKVRRVLSSWLEKMSGWRGRQTEQLAIITQHWSGLDWSETSERLQA